MRIWLFGALKFAFRSVRALWLAVGLALLLLAILDAVAGRVLERAVRQEPEWYRVSFPKRDDRWLSGFAREMADTVQAFELSGRATRWQPFAYYRSTPYAGQHINVDERGLRRTWRAPKTTDVKHMDADRPPRIFVFGGSTAWGFGARDDHTIPSLLARHLAEGPSPAEVTNFGQIGYVSTQEALALYGELQRGNVPDIAVFLNGYNDLSATFLNREAGVSVHEAQRRLEFGVLRRTTAELAQLGAENLALAKLLRAARHGALIRAPASGSELTVDEVAGRTIDIYAANVRAVEALGRQFGFRARFYWQPVIYLRKNPSTYEHELLAPRQLQRQLCSAGQWALVEAVAAGRCGSGDKSTSVVADLTSAFDDVEWSERTAFYDSCHTIEPAGGEVARRIAADLLSILEEIRATRGKPSAADSP